MRTPTRPLAPAAALLSAAALAAGLLAPVAASAHGAGQADRSALRAEREQERVVRAEEHANRAQERRANRAAERAARKATREAERAARRSARHGGEAQSNADPGSTTPGSETEGVTTPAEPTAPAKPSTPASGDELKHCSASIESSSSLITAGDTVTIFGKLTCPSGVTVGERLLTVSEGRQGTPAAALAVLGAATTEADGSYKIGPVAPDANTTFRVRVGNRGAHTVVKVAPLVTLSGPSPAATLSTVGGHTLGAHPARVTFSGTVKPGDGGGRVSLQVAYAESGEQWRTVAFADVEADGSYSVAHRFRTAGQASVRVLAHMRGHHVVAASEPLTYEVLQPQNPKLTIYSSPAPLLYGQATTISGVAAEAPNQTVTLLAHTHAGDFAPVTTATTDANGNYSFAAQTPTESTYYRVSIAKTLSTTLYEGVKRTLTLDPLPAATQAGQPVLFTGTVTPADEGQTVYAERQNASGIGFHIVASATIGPTGFSFAHTFTNAGSYTMRIRVPGDPALQTAISAPFSFEVTPAAAAALTPEAPASPAS
jgi:type II secretory pathway pseudopilin PulG